MDGHLVIKFSVDGEVQHVVEMRRKLNDGQYHQVHFTRTGNTATLRVDNLTPKQMDASSSGQLTYTRVCHFATIFYVSTLYYVLSPPSLSLLS